MDDNMCCGICLENVPERPLHRNDDNKYKWCVTECGHLFHRICILTAFFHQSATFEKSVISCPMCRSTLSLSGLTSFRVDLLDTIDSVQRLIRMRRQLIIQRMAIEELTRQVEKEKMIFENLTIVHGFMLEVLETLKPMVAATTNEKHWTEVHVRTFIVEHLFFYQLLLLSYKFQRQKDSAKQYHYVLLYFCYRIRVRKAFCHLYWRTLYE